MAPCQQYISSPPAALAESSVNKCIERLLPHACTMNHACFVDDSSYVKFARLFGTKPCASWQQLHHMTTWGSSTVAAIPCSQQAPNKQSRLERTKLRAGSGDAVWLGYRGQLSLQGWQLAQRLKGCKRATGPGAKGHECRHEGNMGQTEQGTQVQT